jgi:hypothetical protein
VWCLFSTITQQYVGDLLAVVIVVDPILPAIPEAEFLSADYIVSAKVLAELFADSSPQTADMTEEDLAHMEDLLTRHCEMEESLVRRTLRQVRGEHSGGGKSVAVYICVYVCVYADARVWRMCS